MQQNGLNKYGKDRYYRYNLTGKINADISDKVKMMYNSRWIRTNDDRPAYMTGLFYHNIARRWPTNPAFDLELSWRDNIGEFDYGIKAVLSDNRQKVTRYPNENYNLSDWYIGRLNGEI